MNLLAFSHAREDHESAPAARDSLRGSLDFISLWLILPVGQPFLSVSFLSRYVVVLRTNMYFFFASLSLSLHFFSFYPPFSVQRKPRISDIKRFVRQSKCLRNIRGLESWIRQKCWMLRSLSNRSFQNKLLCLNQTQVQEKKDKKYIILKFSCIYSISNYVSYDCYKNSWYRFGIILNEFIGHTFALEQRATETIRESDS